jgi:hypothetical protein
MSQHFAYWEASCGNKPKKCMMKSPGVCHCFYCNPHESAIEESDNVFVEADGLRRRVPVHFVHDCKVCHKEFRCVPPTPRMLGDTPSKRQAPPPPPTPPSPPPPSHRHKTHTHYVNRLASVWFSSPMATIMKKQAASSSVAISVSGNGTGSIPTGLSPIDITRNIGCLTDYYKLRGNQ